MMKSRVNNQVIKKEKLKKTIYLVCKEISEKEYSQIGITTSIAKLNHIPYIAQHICDFLNENGCDCKVVDNRLETTKDKINIIAIKPLNVFSQSIEIACECDGVLMVEKFGHTKYSDFEACLEIAKNSNINIIGVLNLV